MGMLVGGGTGALVGGGAVGAGVTGGLVGAGTTGMGEVGSGAGSGGDPKNPKPFVGVVNWKTKRFMAFKPRA